MYDTLDGQFLLLVQSVGVDTLSTGKGQATDAASHVYHA
jgi:hypothetical protein